MIYYHTSQIKATNLNNWEDLLLLLQNSNLNIMLLKLSFFKQSSDGFKVFVAEKTQVICNKHYYKYVVNNSQFYLIDFYCIFTNEEA